MEAESDSRAGLDKTGVGLLTTGWPCSSGSPDESTQPAGPVNTRTNDAESHASDGSCVPNPAVALIPEELLNLSGPMIGAEDGVAGAVAC
jgi:hypothetical protein